MFTSMGLIMGIRGSLFDILAIPEGVLPVCYLGGPLITTRLRACDCQSLIDIILKGSILD